MTQSPPSVAQDAGLFAVLVILISGLAELVLADAPSSTAMSTFYLAFFIHVGLTLYLGTIGSLRKATWLLLIAVWAGSELTAFATYVFPWGMVAYWLASIPVLGAVLGWLSSDDIRPVLVDHIPWAGIPLVLLGLDLVVMHHPRWRLRPLLGLAAFVAAAFATVVALGLALGGSAIPAAASESPLPTVVPPWHTLPLYAMIRAVPGKLAGILTAFAALFMPLIWPWVRADALRSGWLRWPWRLLCVALALAWVGLGYLGSLPPEGGALAAARLATAFYFAFFLLFPFALGKIARSHGTHTQP